MLAYQAEISALNNSGVQCPPVDAIADDRLAWRWVFHLLPRFLPSRSQFVILGVFIARMTRKNALVGHCLCMRQKRRVLLHFKQF